MISEKEYKKLESSDKESGYAWRAVSQDGDIIYLDGASHRASNWLRFLNCARGQCEENVLVRNIPGNIALVYLFTIFLLLCVILTYNNVYINLEHTINRLLSCILVIK